MTRPGAGPPAPGLAARQSALAARAAALDSTGAHYALFHLAFGPGADQDACERALGAADRYLAELRQAAAALRAAGAPRAVPVAAAAPVTDEGRPTPTAAKRRSSASSVNGGGDAGAGAPR